MTSFGHVLKDIRAARGLSQTALALALDSTQRHVSFLETGRSLPTGSFLSRICRAMSLNIAQRINLYDASGLANPYVSRDMGSDEIRDALDMIEKRVLKNWPFPALVLDPDWNVLRQNDAFTLFFKPLSPQGNEQIDPKSRKATQVLKKLRSASAAKGRKCRKSGAIPNSAVAGTKIRKTRVAYAYACDQSAGVCAHDPQAANTINFTTSGSRCA